MIHFSQNSCSKFTAEHFNEYVVFPRSLKCNQIKGKKLHLCAERNFQARFKSRKTNFSTQTIFFYFDNAKFILNMVNSTLKLSDFFMITCFNPKRIFFLPPTCLPKTLCILFYSGKCVCF